MVESYEPPAEYDDGGELGVFVGRKTTPMVGDRVMCAATGWDAHLPDGLDARPVEHLKKLVPSGEPEYLVART